MLIGTVEKKKENVVFTEDTELIEYVGQLIELGECPVCKSNLMIYYGSSYFNINNSESLAGEIECLNIICDDSNVGFNILDTGELYFINKNKMVYGARIGENKVKILKYIYELTREDMQRGESYDSWS